MNGISINLLRPLRIFILTVVSLCLLLFSPSHVLGYYWVGGSGSSSDPAHWSLTPGGPGGAGVPGRYYDANIILSDGIDRVITGGVGAGYVYVSATGPGNLTIIGNLFGGIGVSVGGHVILNGFINGNDSSINAGGILWNNAGAYVDGPLKIDFSTVNQTGNNIFGYQGVTIGGSTYNFSGGSTASGSSGFIQINSGTVNQTGGTVDASYSGPVNISSGTYNLSGTGVIKGGTGLSISGTFNQTGGQVIGGVLGTGLNGTYNLEGGSLKLLGADTGYNKNSGAFNYKGGSFSIALSPFYNDGTTTLSGSGTRVVDGSVVNNGTWKVTNTTALYTGAFKNNGVYISDPSKNYFKDLYIEDTGYLIGGPGDEFHFSGDFLNHSLNHLWNTDKADLFFGSGTHTFFIGETGKLIWDDMTLDPTARLILQGGAQLYVDDLNFSSLAQFAGHGIIHFDGGILEINRQVPEPATMVLLGIGLMGLAGIRRKFKE